MHRNIYIYIYIKYPYNMDDIDITQSSINTFSRRINLAINDHKNHYLKL